MSNPNTGELLGFHTYRSSHDVTHVQAILVEGPTSVFKRPLCPTRAGRTTMTVIDPATMPVRDLETVTEQINSVWWRGGGLACEYCMIRAGRALERGWLQLGWVHHTL